ncbi:fatty acyl-CoA reductase 3-like [Euphorbia lathyris]|uniref:fatty acyl-CoA reductase 3-like n=1 Tax=Euphorbia lathyris TaxID=212925 RepID=UPI0033132FC1
MEFGSIIQLFENKTILITGATGYLAKIFVEKILRVQPNVKKFYLLVRASDAESAAERLQDEIIGKELFRVIKEKYAENINSFVSEKMSPIPGDISYEHLGIEDSILREKLWEQVDFVLNFAATTNFDERYEIALGINTMGAVNVVNFAKRCQKIQMLVHVSTAYVCGEDSGTILEKPFSMGKAKKGTEKIVIETETKLAQEKLDQLHSEDVSEKAISAAMKDFGLERARTFGWPNTYVFTKAMGEMLLVHLKETLPVVIIRPTMVSSTYKEPFPGWIEGIKTIDSVIAGYGKGKITCFLSSPQSTLDVIPSDMVINGIILAMVARSKKCSEIIYQIGSSSRNPVRFSNFHDYAFRYFSANPWINKDGSQVRIGKGILFNSLPSFHMYMTIRYLLPLKALQVANTVVLKKYEEMYRNLDRKLKLVMRLIELYTPYLLFEGIFDDTNSEKLRKLARETCPSDEIDMFKFDPTEINWEDYIMSAHIPGLVKYVMK